MRLVLSWSRVKTAVKTTFNVLVIFMVALLESLILIYCIEREDMVHDKQGKCKISKFELVNAQ